MKMKNEKSNYLKYKNYIGSVEFSDEDNILYGKILGINDLVSYEGTSMQELENAFIETCKDLDFEDEINSEDELKKTVRKDWENKFIDSGSRNDHEMLIPDVFEDENFDDEEDEKPRNIF